MTGAPIAGSPDPETMRRIARPGLPEHQVASWPGTG